ncbi:MAG: acyl-ACP--UDP-N-acetylglucosamine O-acyltransferase, partial [Planctomycetaceae bacterium]
LSFVGGCSRVTRDIPPYMLASGNEKQTVKTINIVGMRRAGISEHAIRVIKRAHRLLFRQHKNSSDLRSILADELDGVFPFELTTLLNFLEQQSSGKLGRAREVFRDPPESRDELQPKEMHRRAA